MRRGVRLFPRLETEKGKKRTKKKNKNKMLPEAQKYKKGVDQQICPVAQRRNFGGKTAHFLFVFAMAKYFEMGGTIAKGATVKPNTKDTD